MRALTPEDGPGTVLSFTRVLTIRLSSRPDTRDLAAPVLAARTALRDAWERHEEAKDTAIAATGTVAFADAEEDAAIARVALQARAATDADPKHPLWQALFASGAPSTVTAGVATDEQAALATHLIHTIAKDPAAAALKPLLPQLEAARHGVTHAQASRAKADAAELGAWNALQVAEKEARDAYNGTHPHLVIRFPGERRLVDSFFVKPKRKKKADASDDVEAG